MCGGQSYYRDELGNLSQAKCVQEGSPRDHAIFEFETTLFSIGLPSSVLP